METSQKKPMNKFLKFVLVCVCIVAGLFIVLLGIAAVIIPVKYPPAKMKAIATQWFADNLHHQLSIGDIHFNIFSGFEIKDLKVSNRAGWNPSPLVSAKDISISYHLFPLLWGQVSLGEVRLNQPDILVERRGLNSFNFNDMMGAASEASPAPVVAPSSKSDKPVKDKIKGSNKLKSHATLPDSERNQASEFYFAPSAWADTNTSSGKSSSSLNYTVGSVNIIHGKMLYLDETTGASQSYNLKDLNLNVKNISTIGGKTSLTLSTPLDYNNMVYQLSMKASFRYYLASQSLKELKLDGQVNDLGFGLSGSAEDMTVNITPDMDGNASLDMLKFSGLVPKNLSSMPQGLSLTGPAKVKFHLGGNKKKGLELSGTADGSELAIQYKDLFIKKSNTTCKIDFKSVMGDNFYELPSFTVTYQDWSLDGSFRYENGSSYTCKLNSKALPLKGLSDMVPRLKKATFDGETSLNVTLSQNLNKDKSFRANGQVNIKDVGITLPDEPYLEKLNAVINFDNTVVKIPSATFQSFDGSGAIGVTVNLASSAYLYSLSLKGVNAQKAVNTCVDVYVTSNPQADKDKLFGTMNFAYKGSGKGFSAAEATASQLGSGNFSIENAKIKGVSAITAINKYFKDSSDEMAFDQIIGTLGMKSKVFSNTVNTTGKVGTIRETGGVNVATMSYSPDMRIQCDVKKEFLNSDAILSALPGEVKGLVKNLDWFVDDKGNIPVDIKMTGLVSAKNWTYDWTRLINNVKKHLSNAATKAVQNAAQQGVQNLGNKLKGLFGH